MLDELAAASFGVPLLHQVLNFFEFSKVELLLVSQTAFSEFIAVGTVKHGRAGINTIICFRIFRLFLCSVAVEEGVAGKH